MIYFYFLKLVSFSLFKKNSKEKTRANAAGALGNFVRNSNVLARDLIKYGALHQLMEVVRSDPGPVTFFI